jgi:hypothetical protein
MVEAVQPCWLHPTFTLYLYKVFEHLKMLWIGSWMQPYTADTPAEGGPRFWEIGVWVNIMVEAVQPRWLHPTFTLCMYKVFEHLKMLWINSWMQPYNDTPAEGGPRFWEIGVTLSGYDAMMSWLRLLSPTDCILLSHYIYIKCLSTLRRCCG